MSFRILICLQIVWICLTAMAFRGVVPYPDNRFTDLLVVGALYFFPAVVLGAGIREGNPWRVALAEAGLTAAYFLAVLPGVQ